MPPRDERSPHERVLSRLDVRSRYECWDWQGRSVTQSGHAVLTDAGRTLRAHVVMYVERWGPVPPGLQVNHYCGRAICCNPEHLYAGTQWMNIQDMIRAGTHVNPTAALNAAKAHCAAGHPLSGDNLYLPPNSNERVCRECKRQQWRAWNARRQGATTPKKGAASCAV